LHLTMSKSVDDKAAAKAARKAAKKEVDGDVKATKKETKDKKRKRDAEEGASPSKEKKEKKKSKKAADAKPAGSDSVDTPTTAAPAVENALDQFRLAEPIKSLLRSKGIEALFMIQVRPQPAKARCAAPPRPAPPAKSISACHAHTAACSAWLHG